MLMGLLRCNTMLSPNIVGKVILAMAAVIKSIQVNNKAIVFFMLKTLLYGIIICIAKVGKNKVTAVNGSQHFNVPETLSIFRRDKKGTMNKGVRSLW